MLRRAPLALALDIGPDGGGYRLQTEHLLCRRYLLFDVWIIRDPSRVLPEDSNGMASSGNNEEDSDRMSACEAGRRPGMKLSSLFARFQV